MTATVFTAVRFTVQEVPLLLVQPDHPLTLWPDTGAAVRVTVDPVVKLAEQVAPQLMPAGVLVTVPFPDGETLSRLVVGAKVATTAFAALSECDQAI